MECMNTPVFQSQPAVPAPGEPEQARIVTAPVYPNAARALEDWESLRGRVPASLVVLRMVAAPVVDRASGHRAGLRGFRLVSDGCGPVELVTTQVKAMNAAAAARPVSIPA